MWFNFKERIHFWERRLFSTAVVNVTTTKTRLDVGDEINGKEFSSHASATWPQHMCALGRFSEGWCLVKEGCRVLSVSLNQLHVLGIFLCAGYWKCIRSSLVQYFYDPSSDKTDFYHELMRFALFTETQVRKVTLSNGLIAAQPCYKDTPAVNRCSHIIQSSCLIHTSTYVKCLKMLCHKFRHWLFWPCKNGCVHI